MDAISEEQPPAEEPEDSSADTDAVASTADAATAAAHPMHTHAELTHNEAPSAVHSTTAASMDLGSPDGIRSPASPAWDGVPMEGQTMSLDDLELVRLRAEEQREAERSEAESAALAELKLVSEKALQRRASEKAVQVLGTNTGCNLCRSAHRSKRSGAYGSSSAATSTL